jgi:hypothetical protein
MVSSLAERQQRLRMDNGRQTQIERLSTDRADKAA